MNEQYTTLMKDLAAVFNVPSDFFLDSPCVIGNERLNIVMDYNTASTHDDLCLYSTLGTMTDAHELALCRLLLDANYLWDATEGGTLGVDSHTGNIILAYRLPLDMLDGATLAELLEAFEETALAWSGLIAAIQETPAEEPLDPRLTGLAGGIRA